MTKTEIEFAFEQSPDLLALYRRWTKLVSKGFGDYAVFSSAPRHLIQPDGSPASIMTFFKFLPKDTESKDDWFPCDLTAELEIIAEGMRAGSYEESALLLFEARAYTNLYFLNEAYAESDIAFAKLLRKYRQLQ